MTLLSQNAAKTMVKSLRGWKLVGKEIRKEYKFKDFVEAMGFVTSVALKAERANHHPDIDIRWNIVVIVLSTHSEGGVTEKDVALAREIEKI